MFAEEQQKQALAALPPELQGFAASNPAAEAHEAIPASEWVDVPNQDSTLDTPADSLPAIAPLKLDDLPELRPELISGVLRQGHVLMLSAPSKAGKTWCLIELAVAIATGSKWLGHRCHTGRVLYIDGETDSNSLIHRFKDVVDRVAPLDLDVMDKIDVWSLRGKTRKLQDLVPSIVERAAGGEYTLVVVDPAYPFLSGDENKAGDVRGFFTALNSIAESLDCAVAFDHHHGKGSKGDTASIDRASGSGMFSRAPDAIVDMIEIFPQVDEWEQIPECDSSTPAFRVSMTLREFPYLPPFDIWFDWPLHIPDATGVLSSWEPRSESRKQEEARRARIASDNKAKTLALDEVIDLMREENGGVPIRLHDLCVRAGIPKNDTARDRIARSEKYKIIHPSGNQALIVPKDG